MTDNERQAKQMIEEADKKLRTVQGFFGSMFGKGSEKLDDAIELYRRAGNKYKMAKKWDAAAQVYCKAASLNAKVGIRHDAAMCYQDAANCYKKTQPSEAVNCLLKAIDIYTDMGKFTFAARHHQTIAELYERDLKDIPKAIVHYEQSGDYFRSEGSNASANKSMLKVAHYAALQEQYQKAIDIYEEIGRSSLESSLLKYSAKEHFFRASLCHLNIDLLNAQLAVKRYEDLYPAFTDGRECLLLKALMEHLDDQNKDGFQQALEKYNSITRLDPWYTVLLSRVEETISDYPDLR